MTVDVRDNQLLIRAQYVKDSSFENPNAPEIFAQIREEAPKIDVNVDVTPQPMGDNTYEVTLTLRADAKSGETSAFVAELEYAGLVSLHPDIDQDAGQVALMVEVPRHLFPLGRAIIAEMTRDGGFPPLVINPIDFRRLYETRKAEREAEAGEAKAGEAKAGAAEADAVAEA